MKKILVTIFLLITSTSFAKLNIAATYPYIADIAQRIGGDRISACALAPGNWDPHFVVPKPSLIAKVRGADLLIMNGAELEIGWLPPVIRESRNAAVQPGADGLLDLSLHLKLIDIPDNVSRAHGDVHPSGNPHFSLDPANIRAAAGIICKKLGALDPDNSAYYHNNFNEFVKTWDKKMLEWETAMKPLKGAKVIQYHKLFDYFFARYSLVPVSEIEPLPGIAPASGHIIKIINLAKTNGVNMILTDVYHSKEPAELIAAKTGIRMIVIPHDVNAVPGAENIFLLFDEIFGRMTK